MQAVTLPDATVRHFASKRRTQIARPQNVYSTFHMLQLLGTVFAALLGLAFGSFLNVCLSRWPEGESVVTPCSHCWICDRPLAWWENIPLLSWLMLRGNCRTCKTWIGMRYPIVEAAVGLAWALIAWHAYQVLFPLEFAVGMMILAWALVGLAVLDAEYLWLPDAITLPSIGLGLCWWFIRDVHVRWALHTASAPGQDFKLVGLRLLGVVAAAGLILLIRWVYTLVRHREGIGLGDAKLLAMLAAWLGFPSALLSFCLGVVLGALFSLVVLAFPAARRDPESWALSKLPLGTFLCIGGIVSSLWGQPIIAAYLRWAGL